MMDKCCYIKNNKPMCPYCRCEKVKISDVDVAIIDGEHHFEFTVRCKNCSNKSYYFLDLDMITRKEVDKISNRFKKIAKEGE